MIPAGPHPARPGGGAAPALARALARFAALVAFLAPSACGTEDAGTGGVPSPAPSPPTAVDPAATAVSTTPTQPAPTGPAPTVGRPGPPAAGQCGVALDDGTPLAGGAVTASVRSGVPGAPFLARVAGATSSTSGSGTLDGSGSGAVRLEVPGATAGQPLQVVVSVAGGAETCSAPLTPR